MKRVKIFLVDKLQISNLFRFISFDAITIGDSDSGFCAM